MVRAEPETERGTLHQPDPDPDRPEPDQPEPDQADSDRSQDPDRPDSTEPPTRLARRLGTADAVVVGLGAMVGAGVFAAFGPAAAAAGGGLLVGLGLAAVVAYCNATSSAQLAAVHPSSGGTYVYGRARLGNLWGFMAGWAFVVGKTASCAAMALTLGVYLTPTDGPDLARPLAVAAVVGLTAVNLLGIRKTALLTRILLVMVLGSLAVVLASALGTPPDADRIGPLLPPGGDGLAGVLEAGGLLFFAFAGYARIATLGEEVRDPARTIPRAVPIALGITLVVYAAVAVAALTAVGPEVLAGTAAPLATVAEAGPWPWAPELVRAGAAVASLGVLLSLLVGVSRTTFAMASEGDLPRALDAVHPSRKVPHRAEIAVSSVVVLVVLSVDLREAIGFSAFAVLFYYAVTNAAAFTLPGRRRRWLRPISVLGLVGCTVLALSLPAVSAVGGAAVLAAGLVVWTVRARRRGRADG